MKLRIKSTNTTILIFGIYQVVGALLGFYVIASLLLRTNEINGALLLIYIIAIGLYSLSMKAGSLLIRQEYKRGLILSMVNQIFQIVSVAIGGYVYSYFSGGKLAAGFDFTDGFKMKLDFALTSKFSLAWNSGEEYYLYINLLAIFLTYVIMDIYEEIFKKDKSVSSSEIDEITENLDDNN